MLTHEEIADSVLTGLTMMGRLYELQGNDDKVSALDGALEYTAFLFRNNGVNSPMVNAVYQINEEAGYSEQTHGEKLGIDPATIAQLQKEILGD